MQGRKWIELLDAQGQLPLRADERMPPHANFKVIMVTSSSAWLPARQFFFCWYKSKDMACPQSIIAVVLADLGGGRWPGGPSAWHQPHLAHVCGRASWRRRSRIHVHQRPSEPALVDGHRDQRLQLTGCELPHVHMRLVGSC